MSPAVTNVGIRMHNQIAINHVFFSYDLPNTKYKVCYTVIPAVGGNPEKNVKDWIPAFAGMTSLAPF